MHSNHISPRMIMIDAICRALRRHLSLVIWFAVVTLRKFGGYVPHRSPNLFILLTFTPHLVRHEKSSPTPTQHPEKSTSSKCKQMYWHSFTSLFIPSSLPLFFCPLVEPRCFICWRAWRLRISLHQLRFAFDIAWWAYCIGHARPLLSRQRRLISMPCCTSRNLKARYCCRDIS